ncbi:MAG: hypothetical protein DHS20C12_28580 [Pseudohongiella sp.]|nr:MAG: hypothetical protein DHS20C12_28580 [Pseudohongiella sp.]
MKTTLPLIFASLLLPTAISHAQDSSAIDSPAATQAQHSHQGQGQQNGQGRHGRGEGHGQGGMSRVRHQYAHRTGIASGYEGASNPLEASASNVAAGRTLFAENCASCHGNEGKGDGPAGVILDPPATNIARFVGMPMAKDDYLLWTISDGGTALETDMPAFKELLSESEIWQLITYLREM